MRVVDRINDAIGGVTQRFEGVGQNRNRDFLFGNPEKKGTPSRDVAAVMLQLEAFEVLMHDAITGGASWRYLDFDVWLLHLLCRLCADDIVASINKQRRPARTGVGRTMSVSIRKTTGSDTETWTLPTEQRRPARTA